MVNIRTQKHLRLNTMKLVGILLVVSALLMLTFLMRSKKMSQMTEYNSYRYVITESGMPYSFDPLDADSTSNLPAARMMYLTPLEVSPSDTLESQILETFSYEIETKTIFFKVKKGLHFENGEPITTHDVVMAILRMIVARPTFPVISDIVGIQEWLQKPHPLTTTPTGIEAIDDTITIRLKRNSEHPLFRFCLELFGIIPSSCVDTKKNAINCEMPSPSGRYKMFERNDHKISFKVRDHFSKDGIPDALDLVYQTPKEGLELQKIPRNTVIAGNESQYTRGELQLLGERFNVIQTPKSRFELLLLNPNNPAFESRKCRQIFIHFFRKFYSQNFPEKTLDGSLTSQLIPGYLSLSKLESTEEYSHKDIELCSQALRKTKYTLGALGPSKNVKFQLAINATLASFDIKDAEFQDVSNVDDFYNKYVAGEVAMMAGASGLWPLDPFGDLKMFFTPNLHKPLFAQHRDQHLQSILDELYESPTAAKAEQLNRYLFEDASVNVLEHFSRFYLTSKEIDDPKYTSSITSLSPWQVFSK